MCVNITKRVKNPTKKVITVWKWVGTITQHSWTPWVMGGRFKRGMWVTAKNKDYPFNCWAAKKDRESVRCKARLVEGYGRWMGKKVVFARELFVPKGRKR